MVRDRERVVAEPGQRDTPLEHVDRGGGRPCSLDDQGPPRGVEQRAGQGGHEGGVLFQVVLMRLVPPGAETDRPRRE